MDYSQTPKEIRKKILKMLYLSQTAHLGSALSCVDILTVLYFKILNINPQNPWIKNRDRFILSKGHAVAALYAVLSQRGFFPEEDLAGYCQNGQKLAGHSTRLCAPGVEVSTGSLGHGLSMGAGMALALKKDGKKERVFVLMSDGECQEGSTWEAALFASHHKLDNLVGIIDYNKLQAFGRTNEIITLEPLRKKWESFGWSVKEVNGHNFIEIEKALFRIPFTKKKPSLLIAHTIKGSGGNTACDIFEDKIEWHYKNIDEETYKNALKLLSKKRM